MVKVREDITGNVYNRLTVIRQDDDYIKPDGRKEARWLCRCSCGNYISVTKHHLKSGHTKSCGCYNYENIFKNSKKFNSYNLSGEYGIGYTSNTNEPFYFDLEDYNLIKDYCWYKDNYGYAVSRNIKKVSNSKNIKMHRLIMKPSNNKVVDHINHNTLDNRKTNLRNISRSQNQMNLTRRKDNTSGITGVHLNKKLNKWFAQIQVNNKVIILGYFDKNKFKDAVTARKKAEEKYFGKYSYDNSIKLLDNNILK